MSDFLRTFWSTLSSLIHRLGQRSFPDSCLRGIPGENDLLEDGLVATSVFLFTDNHKKASGVYEQSINWHDDDLAISLTLNQTRRNGELQFKGGVAVMKRSRIDSLSKLPLFKNSLSYERQPHLRNRYHGNLLLEPGFSKPLRKAMAATLATHVSRTISQP